MNLLDVFTLLARRWLMVLLGLAATAAGCYQVLERVGPDYQASSQMLFALPPESTGLLTPSNPLLNLPEGLITTASLVAANVSNKDTERALAAEGNTAEYAVALLPGAGPLLLITTKDKDPDTALATRDAVMELVDAELTELQTEQAAPRRQLIATSASGVSSRAEVLPGSRMRALAGAAGAGLLITLLLAFAVDRLLDRRRRARTARTAEVAQTRRLGGATTGSPGIAAAGPSPVDDQDTSTDRSDPETAIQVELAERPRPRIAPPGRSAPFGDELSEDPPAPSRTLVG